MSKHIGLHHSSMHELRLPNVHTNYASNRPNKLYDAKFYRNAKSRNNSEVDFVSSFNPIHPGYITEQPTLLNKESVVRDSLAIEKKRPLAIKTSISQLKKENLNLLGEFTYTVKNFGRICDGLFEERTRFHLGQRFGKRLAKPGALTVRARVSKEASQLFTLGQVGLKGLADSPVGELKINTFMDNLVRVVEWKDNDSRIFIKRVIIHKGVGMVILFKSFEISLIDDQQPQQRGRKKKQAAPLRMFFSDLMNLIKIDESRIVELVKSRMELVEGGRLKLDTEGWDFGNGLLPDWQLDEGEQVQAEIGSKINRKYKVSYPVIDLYVPEQQYTQTIYLKLSELVDLMKQDFTNITDYADRFDMKKYEKQVKLNKLYEKRKKDQVAKNPEEENKETEVQVGPTEEDIQQEEIEEYTISVANNSQEYDSKHWEQRIVKETLGDQITISFIPSTVAIQEKKSKKLIKQVVLSFKQYYELVVWSETEVVTKCLDLMEIVFPGLDEADWEFEKFKETCRINIEFPDVSHEDLVKVGEVNILNQLFQPYVKDFEKNFKKLEMVWSPAYIEVHDVPKQKKTQIKLKTSTLNEMIKRQFWFKFRLL